MTIRTLAATGLILLTLGACAGGGAVGSKAPDPATPSAPAVGSGAVTAVTERDFRFDTPTVTVRSPAALAVTNAGPTVHNLAIRGSTGAVLGTTTDLKPGTSETLPVDLPAGTYTIFCSLPGHESLGLTGTLTVR